MIGQFIAEQAVDRRRFLFAAAVFDGGEFRPSAARADESRSGPPSEQSTGNADVEKEDGDKEGRHGDARPSPGFSQRPAADPRAAAWTTTASTAAFEPEEKALDQPDIAEGGIDVAENQDGEEARQDEQAPRDQASLWSCAATNRYRRRVAAPPAQVEACSSSRRRGAGSPQSSSPPRPECGASRRFVRRDHRNSTPRYGATPSRLR